MKFCRLIYKRLQDDDRSSQEEAIKRSEKLLEDQKDVRLANQNPATSIHLLVEELNKHI